MTSPVHGSTRRWNPADCAVAFRAKVHFRKPWFGADRPARETDATPSMPSRTNAALACIPLTFIAPRAFRSTNVSSIFYRTQQVLTSHPDCGRLEEGIHGFTRCKTAGADTCEQEYSAKRFLRKSRQQQRVHHNWPLGTESEIRATIATDCHRDYDGSKYLFPWLVLRRAAIMTSTLVRQPAASGELASLSSCP